MVTPTDIDRMIAERENFEVEFKGEAKCPLPDNDLLEAVVCLANGHGGMLLVGVEDPPLAHYAIPLLR